MLRNLPVTPAIHLSIVLLVGACAEGTKVDLGLGPSNGGDQSSAGGSVPGKGPGGSSSNGRGGVPANGGSGNRFQGGGTSSNLTTMASAGTMASPSSAGARATGGTTGTAGSVAATGGAAQSTVAAPVGGLGIFVEKQSIDSGNVRTDFFLVNSGSQPVDLTTVRIRYYFTMDAWVTPVLEVYYAGPNVEKENIKSDFFAVTLPAADRYFEMSFVQATVNASVVSPSVAGDGRLSIQIGLHDQNWLTPDAANDYSYAGALVGYTERILVYVGENLVWGIEPQTEPQSGAGGVGGGGAAGDAGTAGASSFGGREGGEGGAGATAGMSMAGSSTTSMSAAGAST